MVLIYGLRRSLKTPEIKAQFFPIIVGLMSNPETHSIYGTTAQNLDILPRLASTHALGIRKGLSAPMADRPQS